MPIEVRSVDSGVDTSAYAKLSWTELSNITATEVIVYASGGTYGAVWTTMLPVVIPFGATLLGVDVTCTVRRGHARPGPPVPAPLILVDGDLNHVDNGDLGIWGAGGPGNLAATLDWQTVTYDYTVYPSQSGGGGLFVTPNAFLAAVNSGLAVVALRPQIVNSYIAYDKDIAFTWWYEIEVAEASISGRLATPRARFAQPRSGS